MAERPLLILPTPERTPSPRIQGASGTIRKPSRDTQVHRFQPVFQRLRQALDGDSRGVMELRDDPSILAPERVIVFEIAGSVSNFVNAIEKVPGLEFISEYDTEEPPDKLFAVKDTRKGKEGKFRKDKNVPGRFYLATPTTDALREILSLWERWSRGESLGTGYTPFEHVFAQLRVLRPWGAKDRILNETIKYWKEEIEQNPDRPVRTEVELWFYQTKVKRREAKSRFFAYVKEAGGQVVHEAVISDIAYHGALIDIPAHEVSALIERQEVHLAIADDVMFLRPQSLLINELKPEEVEQSGLEGRVGPPGTNEPIAALLDGVPLQGHNLLDRRLTIDDPDNLENIAIASGRIHGTAMASLILHGDLNAGEPSLDRPLYVRPIMFAPENGQEQTDGGRLLIDTIYRALLRMKGSEGEEAVAPTVFLVNLSIGDIHRPFTRLVSPLARLLDFLSERYGILFLVSGGNVTKSLWLDKFDRWTDFENASPTDRERAILKALNAAKHERTILSPAEALNALTIGAQHHDNITSRRTASMATDPFDDYELPNASSALGLGYRRTIKPEIYLPGGREHVRWGYTTGDGTKVHFGPPQDLYGLSAAAPDSSKKGQLSNTALSDGTSSATALATRAAHRIFDALMDRNGGSLLADIPPEFYAVVVKALLVHRSQWSGKCDLLKEICGPKDGRRFVERAENISRFMGFGIPNTLEAMECTSNRATLVGYGMLKHNQAHKYRIPLPTSLELVTVSRALTITLTWFSPVKPGYQNYRCVKLEASPDKPLDSLGVKRFRDQPAHASIKKGTVFHERYHGAKAVSFMDDGHLSLQVWCKGDAGSVERAIHYGIAITLESEAKISIYDEIEQRLRIAPQPLT